MEKVDFKKKYKNLYAPSSNAPSIVEVPPMQFAVLSGIGDPNTSKTFSQSIEALFGMAYTISMSYKSDAFIIPDFYNFTVPPLEGVWDIAEGTTFVKNYKEKFKWTIGIMMPDFVTESVLEKAKEISFAKKKNSLINNIQLQKFNDGLCCTFMHIGSYDDEDASFELMQKFIEQEGYTRTEKTHREIYLSDFRKVEPAKLKTVLRFKIAKR